MNRFTLVRAMPVFGSNDVRLWENLDAPPPPDNSALRHRREKKGSGLHLFANW